MQGQVQQYTDFGLRAHIELRFTINEGFNISTSEIHNNSGMMHDWCQQKLLFSRMLHAAGLSKKIDREIDYIKSGTTIIIDFSRILS